MNRPIDDLPATVTFGSSSFSAAVTQATTGVDIEEGGFLPSRDIVLHVAIFRSMASRNFPMLRQNLSPSIRVSF
jgi:hypothetical protein